MAKILSKSGISTLQIVRPWHVTQSIDAFAGIHAYDITLSGSMTITGSVLLNGLSSTTQTNILTYNTSTGKVFYTASSAIGGGGQTTPGGNNYEIQFNSASAFQATSSLKFNYLSQSLEHGLNVSATGSYAHAEGYLTIASGDYSHAEGLISRAAGVMSHAEGTATLALGTVDHAEGYQTTASSVGFPAGGGATAAAHSEGYNTKAYGIAAHAEGYGTLVSASFAHAEGYGTIANGSASHAEGFLTTASGKYSHTAGWGTHATESGQAQSIVGRYNKPITGIGDFIIGNGTSYANRSNLLHASGNLVTVTGNISSSGTVFGVTGSFSHLVGNSPITVGSPTNFLFPITASNILTSNQTGSFITNSQTGSFATTGSNNFSGSQTVTGSVVILSGDTPGVRIASNNDVSEEVKIYDAKMTIEDSGAELVTLATNVNSSRLGTLQLANWTSNLVGVYLNGYKDNFYANWIGGALIVGRSYNLSSFTHHVALDVSGSALVTGSLTVTEDITASGAISSSGTVSMLTASIGGGIFTSASLAAGGGGGGSTFPFTGSAAISGTLSLDGPAGNLNLFGGNIDIKNAGAQSNVKFYCESSNAHYTQLQAPSHSAYSGNVITTLPAYDFNFSTPNFQANITASGAISSSGTVSMLTASIGGGIFTSASLAAGGGGGGSTFPFTGDAVITGSLVVNASSSTSQSLSVIGSGSTVFDVVGSVGTLFSVDDNLTETLFTANDISGLPVLQASASGEVFIGKSPQSLYSTAVISSTVANVSHSLCMLSTSSYDGAFFEYTVISSSNARAGNIMSVWNSSIASTETTSSQIGNTSDLTTKVIISGSTARLVAYGSKSSYKVKTIIKAI